MHISEYGADLYERDGNPSPPNSQPKINTPGNAGSKSYVIHVRERMNWGEPELFKNLVSVMHEIVKHGAIRLFYYGRSGMYDNFRKLLGHMFPEDNKLGLEIKMERRSIQMYDMERNSGVFEVDISIVKPWDLLVDYLADVKGAHSINCSVDGDKVIYTVPGADPPKQTRDRKELMTEMYEYNRNRNK